jgi:hypothetical protein
VGGDFTTISLASRRGFAAIGLTGTGTAQPLDLQLQAPSTANFVRAILLQGSSLYVGGQFTTNVLTGRQPLLAGVNITSGLPIPVPLGSDFNGAPGTAFGANALASANGSVFVGGDFQSLGGVPRQRAAALSLDTGAALPWAPGFDNPVLCLAYGTNRVYVGGMFTNYNTTNLTPSLGLGLGAVDPVTGNPVRFAFLGTNALGLVSISSLVVSSNALYAGGAFTIVAGQPRRFVAALDPGTGNLITGFNANLGGGYGGISAMALAGTNLYLAGDFTTVNAQAIPRLTAVSAATGASLNWVPTPNQPVTVLSASTDTLYVGGAFTSVNPDGAGAITLNHFAAFSLADNSLVNVDASLKNYDSVTALAASPSVVYVGGSFTAIGSGGDSRQNLANLSPADASAYAWNPSPDVGPVVITLTDNYALTGGTFRFVGQAPTNLVNGYFAAFSRSPQMSIKRSSPGNVEIDFTTSDRADAVLQGSTGIAGSGWTDIATYGSGFPQSTILPDTAPHQFFRVVTH